jgi:peroxiredoxin
MTTRDILPPLLLGDRAPAFDLAATDGQRYSLHSFIETPFLVVIFLANHCPYVSAWEDRIIRVAHEFAPRGFAFVAISSSDASKIPADSFEAMGRRVQERSYPFPYLYDQDQSVGRSFGATRTPEVFVFDGDRTLVYHGAVDSDFEEGADMENYLRDALHRLHTGQSVFLPETPILGCVIKYT